MDLMKKLTMILLSGLIFFAFNNIKAAEDECFNCHDSQGDNPSALFRNDIHHKKGIPCSGCHGGNSKSDDMDAAMNKNAGFIGIPKGDQISERCAACHSNPESMKQYGAKIPTNQMELLSKSVHGKLSINGKERIVQCITCHNAHGIVEVTNPASPVYPLNLPKTCSSCHSNAVYMRDYNPALPVDQLNKYRTSVHGIRNAKGDIKVAECESCHGSHGILPVKDANSSVYVINIPKTCAKCHSNKEYMKGYNIPTDQYEQFTKSVHGIDLLEKHDLSAPACNSCHGNHGAVPPGVESISEVCGTCHALNADLFSASPHKKAFDEHHYPECETCHGNHGIVVPTDNFLGISKGSVCIKCHTANENVKGYIAAKHMGAMMDSLDYAEKLADSLINNAEQKGMEISEAKYKLRDVRQSKLEARTMVHSFNEQKFDSVVARKGLAASSIVIGDARAAIHEYYFRRIGLGISVLIISFLAFVLYLYIKRIERKK
jgi:predicted CXXCH cytochrome family protein